MNKLPIASRMYVEAASRNNYNPDIIDCVVFLDNEYFATVKVKYWDIERIYEHFPRVPASIQLKMLTIYCIDYLEKQWEVKCDQTSSMELQYRKTIISECGRLRVKESLSLMETCCPTS